MAQVVKLFRDLVKDPNSHEIEPEIRQKFEWIKEHIVELKGKRLACWCKVDSCCHSDDLIELANK